MAKLLHPKATAVWLVDNTTISFKQIADFVGMHELEIQGIADGDVAAGVKGFSIKSTRLGSMPCCESVSSVKPDMKSTRSSGRTSAARRAVTLAWLPSEK